MLFHRSTDFPADDPGAAQFSREFVEVEDSPQNPQEVKRTIQVLRLCLHCLIVHTRGQQVQDDAVTASLLY